MTSLVCLRTNKEVRLAEEVSFYSDERGVRVTDKRVIVENTTYSLANITSVATRREEASATGPFLFMAIGGVLLIGGLTSRSGSAADIGGAVVGLIGYFWYRGLKPTWHLRIASASGESTPLSSLNQKWIESISHAINEAIVHRQ